MSSTTGLDAPASGRAPTAPSGGRGFLKIAEPIFWACVSIGLFAGLWELLWAIGSLNPLLLPPPHLIVQDIPGTLKFFDRANKVGTLATGGGFSALLVTIAFTTMRVLLGLSFGFVGGVFVGAAIHYSRWVRRLLLPTILMLAPISPVAWLPVAIFVFGIGDVPAIFLVFVTVFLRTVPIYSVPFVVSRPHESRRPTCRRCHQRETLRKAAASSYRGANDRGTG